VKVVLKWSTLAGVAVGLAIWLGAFGGAGELPSGRIAAAWLAVVVLFAGSIAGVVYERKAGR
jgi:hypothetical protein